ncbi:MAG: hypothetical protein AVDCRST_MAG40-878, partial [uncultured Gemmatimonadaceae bacterium]
CRCAGCSSATRRADLRRRRCSTPTRRPGPRRSLAGSCSAGSWRSRWRRPAATWASRRSASGPRPPSGAPPRRCSAPSRSSRCSPTSAWPIPPAPSGKPR